MVYRDKAWYRARRLESEARVRYWAQFDEPKPASTKLRGNRRYYKKLDAWVKQFKFPKLSVDDWFDFSHQHVDWKGRGNQGMKHRRAHLQVLVQVFERTLESVSEWEKPCQIWIFVDERDSSQDAVFIHSANPNSENYPCDWGHVIWLDNGMPCFLKEFDCDRFEVGRSQNEHSNFFIIRLRGQQRP